MRYTHFKIRFLLLAAIGVLLATLAGAQGSSTLQELNVLGKLKIPIYNALPAAGGFKQGSVIYQYSGTDSGVYIRSYTGPVWNKVWPVAGTGGTVVDTFYYRLRPVPGDSTKWVFDRSDRTDTLDLSKALTGGDTTVLQQTIDSTGRTQGQWIFSGPNRKLTSSPYFLYDSALRKVTINSLNVSYGGPGVRFAVNGAAHISDLYLDGQVINISKPTSSTYPIGWNYTTKQIEKYTMWPKGVVSFGKNASRDSFVMVLDDGTRIAERDSIGSGGGGGVTAVGTFASAGDAKGLSISSSNVIMHPATATTPGGVSTGAQTWAGAKTFTSTIFANENNGDAGEKIRFRGSSSGTRFGIGLSNNLWYQFYTVDSRGFTWNKGGDLQPDGTNELMKLSPSELSIRVPINIATTALPLNLDPTAAGSGLRITYRGTGISSSFGVGLSAGLHLQHFIVSTRDFVWVTGGSLQPDGTNELARIKGDGSGMAIGTNSPHASAKLDVASTSQGILPPRMTGTQMNAISDPAAGLQIYNNTSSQPHYRDGSTWQAMPGMTFGTAAPTSTPVSRGNWYLDYTNKKMYYATGTSSSADWTMVGGGSSSDTTKMNTMPVSGTLFALSSIPDGAERNYFTTSGAASITSGSSELTLNGIATVATTNIVNVPLDMANEKWVQVARFRCNVTTGTQRIGLGTRPSNTANINRGFTYTFDMSSGVDKGKGFIFTGNAGTFTQRAVSAALPLSNNDVVELTVERNGYTFNCKSKNITTGDSVTVSYDYPITSTSEPVMLPTSRPAIYQLNQANQTLLSWSFTDNTPVNPYLLIIGDSKTAGHNATAASGRFVSQLQSAHADSVFAFSGYGDELTDAIKWLPLIRKVRPKNVVIALGSNDVRNSRTEVAIVENLSRIYEACKYVNANVFFLGMGETTINQSYLWQQATTIVGSANMILTYPALAGDGVHLSNTAAHTTVKTAIEAKLF